MAGATRIAVPPTLFCQEMDSIVHWPMGRWNNCIVLPLKLGLKRNKGLAQRLNLMFFFANSCFGHIGLSTFVQN